MGSRAVVHKSGVVTWEEFQESIREIANSLTADIIGGVGGEGGYFLPEGGKRDSITMDSELQSPRKNPSDGGEFTPQP